jgi:hypothetical protein
MLLLATLLLGLIYETTSAGAFVVVPLSSTTNGPKNHRQFDVNKQQLRMVPFLTDIPTTMMPTAPSSIVLPSNNNYNSVRPTNDALIKGITSYYHDSSSSGSLESSSTIVSLQEIKKVTKEEIEQKKMTFNVIFWGGGFVAPLLATVFYFGTRFWEK